MNKIISIVALIFALINVMLILFALIYSRKDDHKSKIINIIIRLIFACSAIVVILEGINLFI